MEMDRKMWTNQFQESHLPSWPCPNCYVGVLEIEEGSLVITETASSLEIKRMEVWDFEWIVQRFQLRLSCMRPQCRESVIVIGKTNTIEVWDEEADDHLSDAEYLVPQFFYPAPPIFRIPEDCAEDVVDEIHKAFSLYWFDTAASANRIRASVELLLTNQKVIKSQRTKSGKIETLTLHRRIELFKMNRPQLGDALMAIKWLGNYGSHLSKLERSDLLDAFEILDHVLDEIFAKRAEKISKIAKQINRRKGPRPKQKRRVF